jgi:cyclophilin family peptidyl-prolyl cis-trans isomerase
MTGSVLRWRTVLVLALAFGSLLLAAGVVAQDFADPDEAAAACWPEEEADTSEGFPQWSEPPELVIDDSGETAYTATFATSAGEFAVELLPAEAPATVNSFVCLAWVGYYDETVFHRVVPGFVIQGGDPTATGTGGPGYAFDDEPIERNYETGTLSMANAGPDTNGSQFFVVLEGGAGFLEPLYTIFGQVADEESLEVVEAIGACDADGDEIDQNGECDVAEPVEIEMIAIEASEGDEGA